MMTAGVNTPQSPGREERARGIRRVLLGILGLNLLVAAAKLLYGWKSGAIALSADGLHSLLDGSSNVVGLVGIAVASRPPDANHPYGHRKYETVAALAIAALMLFGCHEIIGAAIERWRHPRLPEIGPTGYLVVALTLAINVLVVVIERREGRRLGSELLESDAAHTASDVLASLLVLASFAALQFGVTWADIAAAGLIVVLILRSGFEILKSTLSTLSDEIRIAPDRVESVALEEPGVLEAHNVRSRGASDDIHIDLHILVDPAMPIADAHAIGHRVQERIVGRWPEVSDVIVHVEPGFDSERAEVREGGGLKAKG